jgi:diadenosine tetraphosphatase ApaH/serine/threonine PP2A family protein phosphatase
MPRIALVSDIHSNIDAWEEVLKDIRGQDIAEILCLGDVVGYGAAPAECLRLVRERCGAMVLGNHDEYLVKGFENFVLGRRLGDPIRLAEATAFAGDLQWLGQQPLATEVHGFSVVHSSLHHPEQFHYLDSDLVSLMHFDVQKTPVCFFGHTHRPEVVALQEGRIRWGLLPEGRLLLDRSLPMAVNVGSVGQPRDRDPRAAYGVYDSGTGILELRRIPYDIDSAVRRIREAGLPEENGLRLLRGE